MRSPSISPRWVLASPCENREEGRKEGFLARIAIFFFFVCVLWMFFLFFWLPVSKSLCRFLFCCSRL
jgi:hypothetical protein